MSLQRSQPLSRTALVEQTRRNGRQPARQAHKLVGRTADLVVAFLGEDTLRVYAVAPTAWQACFMPSTAVLP